VIEYVFYSKNGTQFSVMAFSRNDAMKILSDFGIDLNKVK